MNGTKIKLNDRDELKGVTFVRFKASHSDVAELTLRIDVIPDSIKGERSDIKCQHKIKLQRLFH